MAISPPNIIGENSAATPGLWNSIVTQLWANDLSLSGGTFGTSSNTLTPESGNTITVAANNLVTNYVYASTPQTTPTAFAATQLRGFVSTVYGAVLMGFGTTADVTLMNRAGTPVLVVGPNTTNVYASGAEAGAAYLTDGFAGNVAITAARATDIPILRMRRVETSFAVPTIITNGQEIGDIRFEGFLTGTTFHIGSIIRATATEGWVASTAAGTKLTFLVTANGTVTRTVALTLDHNASATFVSNITQSSGTAALQAVTATTGGFSGLLSTTAGVQLRGADATAYELMRYVGGSNNPGLLVSVTEATKHVSLFASGSAIAGQQLQLGAEASTQLILAAGTGTVTLTGAAFTNVRDFTQIAGTAALQAITGTTLIGSDATDATNSTSGAFKTAGGMGIAKKLFVGTSLTVGTGFGCNAAAAQTAYASGGALNAYGAGANGFDTGANASALHALVVNIRAALVNNGIMT